MKCKAKSSTSHEYMTCDVAIHVLHMYRIARTLHTTFLSFEHITRIAMCILHARRTSSGRNKGAIWMKLNELAQLTCEAMLFPIRYGTGDA